MEFKKKAFVLMVLCLILGIVAGFYLGNKPGNSKTVIIKNQATESVGENLDANKKNLALQKLDLLKSYTDFVLLPTEKIADPKKYADEMGAKVKAINDNAITAKFYATGETDNKEQKIVDFLDFLNASISSDLN